MTSTPEPATGAPDSWQDQMIRQNARLNADRVPRIIAAVLAMSMSGFFLAPALVLTNLAFYLLSEVLEPAIMRDFARNPTRLRANLYLGISFMGTCGYAATSAELWILPDLALKFAAVLYLSGGFINVVAVNTQYLPMTVSKLIPLVATWIFMSIGFLWEQGWRPEMALNLGVNLVLFGYLMRVILDQHRTETDLAHARLTAQHLAQTKSRFLASISHEIRTPLNAILGVTRMLSQASAVPVPVTGPGPGPAAGPAPLALLEESALILQAIVDDAIAVAEQDGGGPRDMLATAPLRQSLRVAFSRIEPVAAARGIGLTLDLSPDLPELARFDAVALRRTLVSVVQQVLAQAPPELQRLAIAGGMDWFGPQTLSAPNFWLHLEIATADGFPGLVSGALKSRIREALGDVKGRVSLQSAGDGSGRIVIYVPMADVGAVPGMVQPLPGLQVLVVDDISTNRFIVAHLLRGEGIAVTEADSGAAALRVLGRERVDLILLDMNMPAMSGAETFARVRSSGKSWSGVPVIALTANALGEHRASYAALGLSGFIAKPVDSGLLLAEIRRVMQRV